MLCCPDLQAFFILCNWICTLWLMVSRFPLPQWLTATLSTLHFYYELDCFSFHTSVVLCSLCFWLISLNPLTSRFIQVIEKYIFLIKDILLFQNHLLKKILAFPLKNLGQKSIDYKKKKSPLVIPVSFFVSIHTQLNLVICDSHVLQSHYDHCIGENWTITLSENPGLGSWKPLVKTFHP